MTLSRNAEHSVAAFCTSSRMASFRKKAAQAWQVHPVYECRHFRVSFDPVPVPVAVAVTDADMVIEAIRVTTRSHR